MRADISTTDAAVANRAAVQLQSPPAMLGELPIAHVDVEPIRVDLARPPPQSGASPPSPPLDVHIEQDDAGQNLVQSSDGDFNLLHLVTSGSSWVVWVAVGGVLAVAVVVCCCLRRCRANKDRNRLLARNLGRSVRGSPSLKFIQLTQPEDQMAPLTALQRQQTQHGMLPLRADAPRMAPYAATGLPGGGPYGGPANLDSSKLRTSPSSRRVRGDTRERGLSDWTPGLLPDTRPLASAQLHSTKL